MLRQSSAKAAEREGGFLPAKTTTTHLRLAILILLAAFAGGWIAYIHLRCPVLPYDDSFIFYRFADNLVAGKGLIYNIGERAWGYSTVTYIFWLSFWRYLLPAVPLPDIAVRANLVPFAAVCLAVYFLILRYTRKYTVATAAAALIMFNAALLGISTGGMETFLFMALALFSLLAASSRKPLMAAFLVSLAILTRIEGLLLVPILFILIRKPRKTVFRMTLVMALPPLAWLTFAHNFYGTYLPHSIIAKARPIYTLPRLHAYIDIVRNLGQLFSLPGAIGALLVLVFLGWCTIACLKSRTLREHNAWAVPALFWGILAEYSYGNPLLFEWYYPQVFVPALLTAVLGISAIFEPTLQPLGSRRGAVRTAIGALCTIWLTAATVHGWNAQPPRPNSPNWPVSHLDSEPGRLRCKTYRDAAAWLNGIRKPHETVMAPEIGALGYYLKGNLIDACGLVSPEAIPYLPVPASERLGGEYGSIPLAFVRDVQPEFIVTMPVFGMKNVLDAPWATATYHTVREFSLPVPTYGSDRVLVLRHSPRAPTSDSQAQ
jgi:hypothetical protein